MDINLTIIGQTIAMIVFVWFCMKYIWPPLMQAIEERRETIADGLAASEQAKRDLAAAQDKGEVVVQEARAQAQQIIDQAGVRANAMIDDAKQAATAEGQRLLAAARAEIEQESARARDSLRNEVANIAIAGAGKILNREIDAQANADLLDRLAAEI